MQSTKTPPISEPSGENIDNRGVRLFAFWLGVAIVLIFVAVLALFRILQASRERVERVIQPQVAESLRRTPPQPRLEPDPLAPRLALRAREDAQLSSYGWIDRRAGIVRIPIDRAIEIVAKTGVPGGKPFAPDTSAPTPAPAAPR